MAPTGQTARQSPQNSQASGEVAFGHDLIEAALFHELQGIDHQHVFADVDAFGAGDAAVHVEVEHQGCAYLPE